MTCTKTIRVKNSLLFLTQTLTDLKSNVKYLLEESFKHTNNNLFIYINPFVGKILNASNNSNSGGSGGSDYSYNLNSNIDRYQLKSIINLFYQSSIKINPNVNVTCLLHNLGKPVVTIKQPIVSNIDYELILTDTDINSGNDDKVIDFLKINLPNLKPNQAKFHLITLNTNSQENKLDDSNTDNDLIFKNNLYSNSIVGGTFDRLHVGHKIMLSESALLTKNRLLIGVTTDALLVRKKLTELIQDIDTRCNNVRGFLNLIEPSLELNVVPISDPFGPSIVEKDYQVKKNLCSF